MSIPYIGAPNLTTTIQIPQDLDNADAASVNLSSKAEVDNQVSLLTAYGQLMSSTCPIRIVSTGATTLTVSPIPHAFVLEGGSWKVVNTSVDTLLTAADVEGGGGYIGPNWYYIYIYSAGGLPLFQISPTPPDKYYLYKTGSFAFKYLGAVRFDVTIIPFVKYGGVVSYMTNIMIGSGVNAAITALSSDQYIPTTARIGNFSATIDTSSGSGGATFHMHPNGAPTEYISITYPGNNLVNINFDCAVSNTRIISYSVPFIVGPTTILYLINGYYE